MNIQPKLKNYGTSSREIQDTTFRRLDTYRTLDDHLKRQCSPPFMEAVLSTGRGEDIIKEKFNLSTIHLPATYQFPPQDWQDTVSSFIAMAGDRLMRSAEAEPAREYLRSLGLQEWLWHRALLGFATAYDPVLNKQRPAVCIPHMDIPMNLMAVRFLFVDDEKGSLGYTTMKGSMPLFYGLDTLRGEHETLLIVEGEITQLRIYQAITGQNLASPCWSVISLYNEPLTSEQRSILKALIRKYKRVFVSMDENKISREIKSLLGGECHLKASPNWWVADNPLGVDRG